MKIKIPNLGLLVHTIVNKLRSSNPVQKEVKVEVQPLRPINHIPDEPDEYTFKALAALKIAADMGLEIKPKNKEAGRNPSEKK